VKVITLLEIRPQVNAIVGMSIVTRINRVPLDPTPAIRGVEVWRPPRIARNLDRASGWLTELAALYRQVRRGQLNETSACRLAYIASQAARLAKDLEELKAAQAIQEQLTRIGAAPAPPFDIATPSGAGEVLPP
jgi:hypothetical protein